MNVEYSLPCGFSCVYTNIKARYRLIILHYALLLLCEQVVNSIEFWLIEVKVVSNMSFGNYQSV